MRSQLWAALDQNVLAIMDTRGGGNGMEGMDGWMDGSPLIKQE